jgi:hypothetical protein
VKPPFTYLFDADISPRVAEIMRLLEFDVRALREEFGPDVKDIEFIPQLKDRGWIFVTGDRAMRRRGSPEARALVENRVTGLFLDNFWDHMTLRQQAAWMVQYWGRVDDIVQGLTPWNLGQGAASWRL